MKKMGMVSLGALMALSVLIFQNCGDGFKATEIGSSSLLSNGGPNSGLNCSSVTTFVDCQPGVTLPLNILPNGCPELQCNFVQPPIGTPTCADTTITCAGNQRKVIDIVNACPVERCENISGGGDGGSGGGDGGSGGGDGGSGGGDGGSGGGDGGSGGGDGGSGGGDGGSGGGDTLPPDRMDIQYFQANGAENITFVLAGYPKMGVSANQVSQLCAVALDNLHNDVAARVASIKCLLGGSVVETLNLPAAPMSFFRRSGSHNSLQSTSRPTARHIRQWEFRNTSTPPDHYLIWGDELVESTNSEPEACFSDIPMSYVNGLASADRASFDALFKDCDQTGGGDDGSGGGDDGSGGGDDGACGPGDPAFELVNTIFDRHFDRPAEPGNWWCGQYESRTNDTTFEVDILSGTQIEDRTELDKPENKDRKIAAINFWINNTTSGRPDSLLLDESEKFVFGIYEYWFSRRPDAAGLLHWADKQDNEALSDDQITCHIVGSAANEADRASVRAPNRKTEYLNKCNPDPEPTWLNQTN